MQNETAKIAYMVGRIRASRAMAAEACHRGAALAHAQMSDRYRARLAQQNGLADGNYPVRLASHGKPVFHRASNGVILVAG